MTAKQRVKKLPVRASDGILLAIADLEAIEKQKARFTVDMSTWMQPATDSYGDVIEGKCEVCLAGSVMANTLGLEPDEDALSPFNVKDKSVRYKLMAINEFRQGYISAGVDGWYDEDKKKPALFSLMNVAMLPNRDIPEYSEDKRGFKKALRQLAKDLAEVGL